ncbi:MAG: NAD(P)/FAD-dependent oxidoreductase [Saprospiraceae bacterium]|nr:NAD(P)/FAD-dependent oxidoreductase [Saprospiraceae bacterium]
MNETPVLIIGAGPAGLAMAGRLRKLNIPFEILEKSDRIACAWHEHYDRLHLHTVKELSHLPHLPFPEDYPRYVSRQQLVDYYEMYAKAFDIKPHFDTEIISIKKSNNKWTVKARNGKKWEAEQVVIATGTNRAVNRPIFEGEEKFQGRIMHSRIYKHADPFHDQRVLVVGMGNTGAEIALDLCEHDIETYLSVRSEVNIVPRDTFAGPTQLTALRLAKLPTWLGDWLGTQLRRVMVGDLSRYGIPTAKIPPAKQLRITGKTPVIDIGTIKHIKARKIKVLPGIDHFTKEGVVFTNGEKYAFDTVILATGYAAKLDDFIPDASEVLDEHGWPKSCIGEGKHQGLYFLGYDNYVPGGILGVIYRDSEKIANQISTFKRNIAL